MDAPSLDELSQNDRRLVERFRRAGQGHVFRFLGELDADARATLLAQAASVDLDLLARLHGVANLPGATESATTDRQIRPPGEELIRLPVTEAERGERRAAARRGAELLRSGRVAVMVVAGGQGTRLGSREPKAKFPVGPRSGKSLLAWHAEKVLHWTRALGRPIKFVVMVSEATRAATAAFVEEQRHFGLERDDVLLPCQESMASVDDAGRLLLDDRGLLARSPNGHGGTYRALRDAGVLDRLRADGVEILSYVQVDNPLVRTVDPVFLGHHALRRSQISSKSVAKRSPQEKVGVFARIDGRCGVLEYTELSEEDAHRTTADGRLAFGQGSIAAHLLDLEFARRMADQGLPYHRARKKIPFVDDSGVRVEPDTENGTKFEMYLFDAIPLAERSLVLETRREVEFSPVKNAHGVDSPKSAATDLQTLFRGWYERAGLELPEGVLEVSPLDAPDEEAFRALHGRERPE